MIIPAGMQQQLSEYFQKKSEAYKQAAAKTWAEYAKKLEDLNAIAVEKRSTAQILEIERVEKNFNDELCINLTDAYRQIGISRTCHDTILPPSTQYYNVNITVPGWKNLDQYVFSATANRESMGYTDPITGKTAKLTYNEISMQVENAAQYDKVFVYLVADSLSSFQRTKQNGDLFTEKLNALFKYDAVALAFKGTNAFYYKQKNIAAGKYSFRLAPVTEDALRNELRSYPLDKSPSFQSQFEYQLFEQQEAARQLALRKEEEFRDKVARSIFNCFGESRPVAAPADSNK